MNELLTRREVAAILRCALLTVIRMEAAGKLKPVRLGKMIRHKRADVEALINASQIQQSLVGQ